MIYFTSISEIKTRVINPDNAINCDKKSGAKNGAIPGHFQDFQNAITQKMKRSLGISTFRGNTDHMILPLEEFRGYSLK